MTDRPRRTLCERRAQLNERMETASVRSRNTMPDRVVLEQPHQAVGQARDDHGAGA
jgi:hypothetical protein